MAPLDLKQIWVISDNKLVQVEKTKNSLKNICEFVQVIKFLCRSSRQPLNGIELNITELSGDLFSQAQKIQVAIAKRNFLVRAVIKTRIFMSTGSTLNKEIIKLNVQLQKQGFFLEHVAKLHYPVLMADVYKAVENLDNYRKTAGNYSTPRWALRYGLPPQNPILCYVYERMIAHWAKVFEALKEGKSFADPEVIENCNIAMELGSIAMKACVLYDSLPIDDQNVREDFRYNHLSEQRTFAWVVNLGFSNLYLWLRSVPSFDITTNEWTYSGASNQEEEGKFYDGRSQQASWRKKYNTCKELFLKEIGMEENLMTDQNLQNTLVNPDHFQEIRKSGEYIDYCQKKKNGEIIPNELKKDWVKKEWTYIETYMLSEFTHPVSPKQIQEYCKLRN